MPPILLSHNVRGRCWWYGSRDWTFPPIFCKISLACNRQRHSLTKFCLTWKCVWSKDVPLNSLVQTKLLPLTSVELLLDFYGDQTAHVSAVRRWVVCFSSGDSNMKDKPCSGQPCKFLECGMQVLVHLWQKCTANGGDYIEKVFCSWEVALSNSFIVLFVSVLIST